MNNALFPGQYLDIADIAMVYSLYFPVLAYDPPTQSVTYPSYTIQSRQY